MKKINKTLIIVSALILLTFSIIADPYLFPYTEPVKSFSDYVILLALGVVVLPLIVLWYKALWNNIVPVIFGFREITFWEAFGLVTLIGVLVM